MDSLYWSEKLQVNYHYIFLYIEYRVKVIYMGLNNKVKFKSLVL